MSANKATWFKFVAGTFLFAFFTIEASSAQSNKVSEESGYENRRPVIGGACPTCPWGAIATIVRELMEPADWEVQQCYICSGQDSARIVSEARMPPDERRSRYSESGIPDSPHAPVDFGVTSLAVLTDAYHGRPPYTDGPFDNLRAIALIEHPQYLFVAVRRDTFITDLSQIKAQKVPVRIITDGRKIAPRVLEHYGITEEALKSWGGEMAGRDSGDNFDVIVFRGYLGNTPESGVLYEVTQKHDLRFLELPEPLLDSLAKEFDEFERGTVPIGYMRGVDRPIATVVRTGQAIYGRDDMPDEFAYELARILDSNRTAFIWSHLAFSYNPATVWQTLDVPLHPVAERYYREKGYIR